MTTIATLHSLFLNCSSVSTDSRKIEKDSLFVALKGDNFDANTFAKEALEAVLDKLFKASFETVYCKYLDENMKVKRMLESFGFKPYFIDKDSHQKQDGKTCDEYEVILNKETWLSRTLRINIKDSL